ncbi:myb-related protein MYBAS2-like protein isoform X1 [Cinnamomum micranthum f. kanehirae]|uniref:Myb-related protein MYBAS2-like protein isoform X1 n=1 Tax=Cinnamomum micranthum f. kanehirae TaxID=337451 RepID=A0A3S4PVW0_9MAGN|nr:myb-related protein MYBAS2-like protein isoform X1 [Cinnamomum micranthum f. kanehirae]
MVQEETRKGPWTEQEDLRLICFVGVLGERRWDFIAKVSGLNRTGKSCRLRWVNYLHPGLKRGRMTPQEERLVLELHSRWGNRWSRIARKLPGRTDNEIKNYWRTHMRKKAQERKRTQSPSSSSSLTSSSSSNCLSQTQDDPPVGSMHEFEIEKSLMMSDDKGSCASHTIQGEESEKESTNGYSMEQIWKEIDSSSEVTDGAINDCCNFSCPSMPSPVWDFRYDLPWKMDEEELKIWLPMGEFCCPIHHGRES